jgi:hypothetical protein
VNNNYLDLGTNKSGFVHTFPSGRLRLVAVENGVGVQLLSLAPTGGLLYDIKCTLK